MQVLYIERDTSLDSDQNYYFENLREILNSGFSKHCCEPFPEDMPTPILLVERPTEQVDFHFGGGHIVSTRAKELIQSYNIPAEFIQCEVRDTAGNPAECVYHYMNILDEVPCFDHKRSVYRGEKYIDEIGRLVLKEEMAEGHHFFLVGPRMQKGVDNRENLAHVFYCVSDTLAADMLERGFTNVLFCFPEFWNWHPAKQFAWTPGYRK